MLRESHRPGIEPATCKSQVQRPTAEPPRGHKVELSGRRHISTSGLAASSPPRTLVFAVFRPIRPPYRPLWPGGRSNRSRSSAEYYFRRFDRRSYMLKYRAVLLRKIVSMVWHSKVHRGSSHSCWRSVEPLLRYSDFMNFKMAAVDHLEFVILMFGSPTNSRRIL